MIDVSIQFKCQEQLPFELNLYFFTVQNVYAPDPDPEMTIEQYERTYEQNEDLGLNDMKTENYETSWPLHTLRQQKNIKPGPLCHFNSKFIRCSHQWMLQTNKLSWITAMKVYKTLGGKLFFRVIFFFNHSWLKVQVWFAQSTFTIVCYGQCKVIVMFKSCLIMYILYVYHRYMDFVSVSRE